MRRRGRECDSCRGAAMVGYSSKEIASFLRRAGGRKEKPWGGEKERSRPSRSPGTGEFWEDAASIPGGRTPLGSLEGGGGGGPLQ